MARPGPKSKKGKAVPKSKKVEEKEPEVNESEEEEVKDVDADEVQEDNNGSAEDGESEEEEPPAKKGKGRPKTPAKKTPAKKGGRSSSRGRKAPAKKKVQESESEDDDKEYEVHSIVDERKRKGVVEYKVRWKGYSANAATWEPASNLNCEDAIEEFKQKKEEAKNAPTKSLREAPKKAERYADVAGHGGESRMRHSKRGAGTLGKSPRKNYREVDSD